MCAQGLVEFFLVGKKISLCLQITLHSTPLAQVIIGGKSVQKKCLHVVVPRHSNDDGNGKRENVKTKKKKREKIR